MQDDDSFKLLPPLATAVVLLLVGAAAFHLGDASEFEIARHKAEVGERLRLNAIPAHGELVTMRWDEVEPGKFCLQVRRINPNTYYYKTAEVADVRRIGCQEDFL